MSPLIHFQDSIVLITSKDHANKRFGTGFVIHKESGGFYVLTCAHVIADAGGREMVCAENKPASVIALGEINTTDLSILKISDDFRGPVMSLSISANSGDDFATAGFQLYGKRLVIRKLRGKLGELVGVTYWGRNNRINAWDIHIVDDYQLQPGYSGSPVVSSQGQVVGVVSDRQDKGVRGLAISIEALDEIWKERPQSLQIHGLIPDSKTDVVTSFDGESQFRSVASIEVEQDSPVAYVDKPILIYYKITNNTSTPLVLNSWNLERNTNFVLETLSEVDTSTIVEPSKTCMFDVRLTSRHYGRFFLPILSVSLAKSPDKEKPYHLASPIKSFFVDIDWENELIGREYVISKLLTLYEKAKSRQGQLVLIYGDAGVGKSHTINKFLSKSYISGSICLTGQCESFHKDLSFLPFKLALERTLSLPKFSSTKIRSEQAHIKLLEAFPQLEQSIPYLTYFLLSDHDNNLDVDSKTCRERFFFAFLQLVKNLSESRPIIFYLEDMQWIDASSLDLLQFLFDNIGDIPVLIIGEYRLEEVESKYSSEQKSHSLYSFIRRNITRSNFDQIKIESMSQNNLIEWISKLFPQNELVESFTNLLYNETEGNPLFAREVLKSIIEQNILCQNKIHHWVINKDVKSLGIPSTIEQVIANRIEMLNRAERRELENASVIGRDFAYQILRSVSDIDDYLLMDYLENYLDIRLITEIENRDDYFRFMHGKIREYVYEAIRRFRRRRIHLRLATIMENLYSDALTSVSSIIAYHYKEGGNTEKAIEYYLLAGQEQLKLYSNHEAKANFSEALSLLKSIPGAARDDLLYLQVLNGLSLATRDLNKFNNAIELYKQVLDIAISLQKYEIMVKTASQLATTNSILDHHDEAKYYCSLALEFSKNLDNTTLTSQIANDLVDITRRKHRDASIRNDNIKIDESLKELMTHSQAALEFSRSTNEPTQLIRAYKNVGLTNLINLEYDNAIKMLEEAVRIAETENDTPSKYVYVILGDVYTIKKQHQKALDFYEKYYNWAIEIGAKHAEQKAYQTLALQHINKEEYNKAMSYIEKGLSLYEVVGASNIQALIYICVGYIHEKKNN